MEYLTTYGWSILVIALIITVLFELGVFGKPPSEGFSCVANSGFLCYSSQFSSSGGLTMQVGYTGSIYPITITGLACTENLPAKPPSVETTNITVLQGQELSLVFQCPVTGSALQLGSSSSVELWVYYSTHGVNTLEEEVGRGFITVNYKNLLWNVTEWTPSSNSVALPLLSDIQANPATPLNVIDINTTQWSSFIYNGGTGWGYSTDYHNHDVYNGIETTLFPMIPLSLDNAPCSAPYASHGYTAITYATMNGPYSFSTWTDDGTQIAYRQLSGGSWVNFFPSNAWQAQSPAFYTANVNLAAGEYELAVNYVDTCDPAGLSTVIIYPEPVPA